MRSPASHQIHAVLFRACHPRVPLANKVNIFVYSVWFHFVEDDGVDVFATRQDLRKRTLDILIELLAFFRWDEATWEARAAGSPLRRPGFEGWLRNVAVALGNAPFDREIIAALEARRAEASPLVREHIDWALGEQAAKAPGK